MSKLENEPVISIVIPCKNEESFIEKCVISLLNQKGITGVVELLVVDGRSNDRTRSILSSLSSKYRNVIVLDNPNETTPYALNIGIKNSKGRFISIMGAHAEYDEFFLASGLELMDAHQDVSCVGGPIISIGKNNFGKAVALAMSSQIGVGNAKHRFPNYEGYAEMACFPIFRREIFSEIGLYDEFFIRNQDDEFCFRMNKNGGKVFISPKVRSKYFVRGNVISLFNQYYNYGLWRIAVIKKHRMPISFRQLVPFLFFSVSLIFIVYAIISGKLFIGVILPLVYLLLLIIYTVKVSINNSFLISLNFPLAVFTLHFSYAIGFFIGIFKFGFKKRFTITH